MPNLPPGPPGSVGPYYVYAYLRSSDRSPYYIGKGQKRRAWAPSGRCAGRPADPQNIVMLRTKLTEKEAFEWEVFYIKHYGRKDIGTGTLHNKSDGGEGASGAIRPQEARDIVGDKLRGRPKSEKHKAALRGPRGPQPNITEAAQRRHAPRRAEVKPKVVEMLLAGKTSREIYAETRISPNIISEWRKELNLPSRAKRAAEGRHKRAEQHRLEVMPKIRALLETGMPKIQVIKTLGVSQKLVYEVATKITR